MPFMFYIYKPLFPRYETNKFQLSLFVFLSIDFLVGSVHFYASSLKNISIQGILRYRQ